MMTSIRKCKKYIENYPCNFILLLVLIISLYSLYNCWENFSYWPIRAEIERITQVVTWTTFKNSEIMLTLFGLNFSSEGRTFFIEAIDGSIGWMEVVSTCTPMKAWFYWLFVMIFIPGRWKNKTWYFPLGMVFIYLVNVLRIGLLALVLTYIPTQFNIFHSILEILVYATLFLLWLIWVERF